GARVVAQITQRLGVSDGGAAKMNQPYSSRTLLSHGKVREVAQTCDQTQATAVIFTATLTPRQQHTLTQLLGRPALSLTDIPTTG
ncbi:hypothetical protein, partial [Streptomyces sp. NPDC056144]|uniref:HflX-like GTP-binding protein n=1 Tax=unclassified Streptomyces TaxID=2593676 RepID=UPI0035D6624C